MIVTLTGAFNNVGDHLIRDCAHALLRHCTEREIIDINRCSVTASHYDVFNRARAVLLCGGPAYQADIYPGIYNIDLERISVPVIPFGLGFKGKLGQSPNFTRDSRSFIRHIHDWIEHSSARDDVTANALAAIGVTNVTMTGCPAWYDIDYIDKEYQHKPSIQSVAFSAPATVDRNSVKALHLISKRFAGSEKYLTLHHGLVPQINLSGARSTLGNAGLAGIAKALAFKIVSLRANLARMRSLYDSVDLHIGYRVPAHILRLSRRRPSFLLPRTSVASARLRQWAGKRY